MGYINLFAVRSENDGHKKNTGVHLSNSSFGTH